MLNVSTVSVMDLSLIFIMAVRLTEVLTPSRIVSILQYWPFPPCQAHFTGFNYRNKTGDIVTLSAKKQQSAPHHKHAVKWWRNYHLQSNSLQQSSPDLNVDNICEGHSEKINIWCSSIMKSSLAYTSSLSLVWVTEEVCARGEMFPMIKE